MRRSPHAVLLSLLLLICLGVSIAPVQQSFAQGEISRSIIGKVYDQQNQPVSGAAVQLRPQRPDHFVDETLTQPDGSFILTVTDPLPEIDSLHIERAHFEELQIKLEDRQISQLSSGEPILLPDITMSRRVSVAFWITIFIFGFMLVLIATSKLHNTLSTLLGVALLFGVSYLGEPLNEELFIFTFQDSLGYVDWNVIFLILGMMIVIAVVERTGIFQWLAFFAYRISGGRTWLLAAILMVFTGVASAFLDNVTTMLLMTPITIQIALALNINPLALLMPEVMASNVVGISTLVGTPTNILIGSFANITFNDFLVNLTPGVVLALVGLIIYTEYIYRQDLSSTREISSQLLEQLEQRAEITEPDHLKKAGWVGAGMLILFVFGEQFELLPAVTALLGATALLVWIRPDIEEMIEAVDWTTLVFFITLFIVVGSIQEVGVISLVAGFIGRIVGDNLLLAMLVITFLSALLSMVIANIPFTAAMLPVIGFLSLNIPGAESKVLFYCLSVGSAMGGNGSLIGASANMVTSGIAERVGYRISYIYFLKKGFPALLITVSLATIWLLIRFL